MTAIELVNAEVGTVSSRVDGSVAFRVITPELRPSEAGAIMAYHGKACSVLIKPHEGIPDELVRVDTEREIKTQASRLRAVLYVAWKNDPDGKVSFQSYYEAKMDRFIEHVKAKLPQP